MYCPKCGTQNADTNKYCRACREDLQLVSQALNKHLPMMLAGRIDSVLASKSERFRRDSFLSLAVASGCLASGLAELSRRETRWLPFFLVAAAGCFLLFSLWNYLAYKYSLRLGRGFERDEPLPPGEGSLADSAILTLNLKEQALAMDPAVLPTKEISQETQFLHCPACGAPSSNQGKHCRQCGENLDAIYKAMKKSSLRSALDRRLDKYVKAEGNRLQKALDSGQASGQAGKLTLSMGAVYFLIFLGTWFGEQRFDPFYLTFGVMWSVMGLWDYLFYRRRQSLRSKTNAADSLPDIPAPHAETQTPTTNQLLKPPQSVTEATTRKLADRIREKR